MADKKTYLSESYFYNAAVYYLQRYAAPEVQLRRVLQRKALRAGMRGEEVPADTPKWIEKAVEKCLKLGFVNDQVYTEQKALSLRRQGKARNFIANALREKGVEQALIRQVLMVQDEEGEDTELAAAIRTVRRKRLGRDTTPEGVQKDLAKLARGGFSLDIARRALKANSGGYDEENPS